jgi:hypothetical protein
LKFVFARPGWYPKEMGGFQAPKEVDKNTYKKYDIRISPGLNFYLFAQYILILIVTALFLFNITKIDVPLQIAVTVLIVFSVASLGMLFENKQQAMVLEISRFLLIVALMVYLVFSGLMPVWTAFLAGGIAVISLGVLATLRFHKLARVE